MTPCKPPPPPPSRSHQLIFALAGGSALPLPSLGPDHGLVAFGTTAFCAFVLMRIAAAKQGGWSPLPTTTAGADDVILLVRDGQLQLQPLEDDAITREEIFDALRARGVFHLGQVARFYREPHGAFALVKRRQACAGLCIWPADGRAGHALDAELNACTTCGRLASATGSERPCAGCKGEDWERAVS